MYLPPQFNTQDRVLAARVVRENPLASLISVNEEGLPFVSHVPLHLVEQEGQWQLLGHVAKPNPHGRYLLARPRALVTFLGPHAYMSPQVYPDLARVPTWNYIAVHCEVEAQLIDATQDKDRVLKALIGDHEPAYAAQWRGLGEEYQHKMLAGIMAFSLSVTRVECKIKLNQHRPESHAAMRSMYEAGSPAERDLARWMATLGMGSDKEA